MRTLAEAALDASTCTKCRLSQGRTQVVYGVGDPSADLMFVGEAPGFHEDKQGEPFVGRGRSAAEPAPERGRDLAERRLHQQRDPVPAAREPGPPPGRARGVQAVARRADRDHRSRGRRDARELGDAVHPRTTGLDQPRARSAVPWNGRTVIPTFHPAAVLHGGGQASNQMTALRADFQEIRAALAERPSPPRNSSACFDASRAPRGDGRGDPFDRRHLAAAVAGDAIALAGELGAGKTTFAQGVRAVLGFEGHVVSPTFTLVREYRPARPARRPRRRLQASNVSRTSSTSSWSSRPTTACCSSSGATPSRRSCRTGTWWSSSRSTIGAMSGRSWYGPRARRGSRDGNSAATRAWRRDRAAGEAS